MEDRGSDAAPLAHVHVRVVPGASREEIAGRHGDRIKVRVSAPAESGRANRALLALLADHLGVARRQVKIVRGTTQPLKTVAIHGRGAADVTRLLYSTGR